MKIRKLLILTMIILLQGCIYKSSNHVATIREIPKCCINKSCKFVGQVVGDSIYPFLDVGMQIAKDQAKNQASKLGATHVVWEELRSRGKPVAVARAYRCAR